MPNNGNMGFTYVAAISDGSANVTLNLNVTLDGLDILGNGATNVVFMENGRDLSIMGGPLAGGATGFIHLDGSLLMQSTGNNTDLKVTAGPNGKVLIIDSIFTPGLLQMSNIFSNRIFGATGTETIKFGGGLTVRGSGQIGLNLTTLVNQGAIIADQFEKLLIDPGLGGMTNSGLMAARSGGLLELQAAVYDNTLGEIRAEDLSTVQFNSGIQVIGGLIVAQSGGLFDFRGGTLLGPTIRIDAGGVGEVAGSFLNPTTIENLINNGDIVHNNGKALAMSGLLTNTGNYSMNSTGNNTDLLLIDDTVLDGGGVINMSNTTSNRIFSPSGFKLFTNVDNTIRGAGQIGLNLTTLVNQGAMIADQFTPLRIDPGLGGMTNSGSLQAETLAELRLEPGAFTTSGSVFAATGGTITRVATDYIQTAGSTIIDGSLVLNAGGMVTLDGGILGGSGQVFAHVNNVAGITSPGSSAGTLTANGDYIQGIAGGLAIEIGGTSPGQYDVLAITDDALLAGSLDVTFIDGFDPLVGQTFTVLTATNVFGEFDAIISCAGLNVTYNPDNVILTITSECPDCVGDTNADSQVNVTDLLALLAAWGLCPATCPPDINTDGDVNVTDLLALLAAWGACP
ncbi:MAG: hypothetical protein O7G85_08455 [Planctomycetota bacterium]|nr:hypothetical protein [Planctomycetota bacterium]